VILVNTIISRWGCFKRHAKDYQICQGLSAQYDQQKEREKITRGDCICSLQKPFHLSGFSLLTQEQKKNDVSYQHYYTVPSGGPRATDKGTYDANKFEAGRTLVQRAST
jgi:hypothetical protein